MTDYKPRLFTSDAEIEHIGEGLLARTLPRSKWTHEAHLGATTYLVVRRPEGERRRDLPAHPLRAPTDLVGPGTAQAPARGQEGDRFEEVRLAGPVRTPERHGTAVESQPRAGMAAELREREMLQMRLAHTRIGMTT